MFTLKKSGRKLWSLDISLKKKKKKSSPTVTADFKYKPQDLSAINNAVTGRTSAYRRPSAARWNEAELKNTTAVCTDTFKLVPKPRPDLHQR